MRRASLTHTLSPLRAGFAFLLLASFGGSAWAQGGSSAVYEVRFDATWSSTTHPTAYPFDAHFSPLIGAAHRPGFHLWQPGGIATDGFEVMAELGSPTPLRNEILAAIAAGDAGVVIEGAPIDSPGSTTTTFTVTEEFSRVSLVTMIAPSPDWFIGSESARLRAAGTWQDDVVVQLFAWDAGTDSGGDFLSGNQNVNPHQPISLITAGPFTGAVPLGTYTFSLISVSSGVPALPVWGMIGMTLVMGLVGVRRLRSQLAT